MTVSSQILNGLNDVLKSRGQEIIRSEYLYDWQRNPVAKPVYNQSELSAEARSYLTAENPYLKELQARYSKMSTDVITPLVWREGHVRPEDIAFFRGDNAYVWQVRGGNMNIMGYALAYYYLRSIDTYKLLDQQSEDNAFGNFPFEIGGKLVSRDLMDSLVELYFLDKHLGIFGRQDFTILDVGAGYGRLANRATSVLKGLKNYYCTDAVPFSTFISDYYLRYRGVYPKASVIPLDEIEAKLALVKPDLAVNIHSFSECQVSAVNWWVALLAKSGVKHFMIAPNATNSGGEKLQTNDLKDFSSILAKHGYKQIAREPKYRDPVIQQYAISPTWHYLFELS